jgi:hypothetical protein
MGKRMKISISMAMLSLLAAAPVLAHHSFAVFFDSERMIQVEGTVEEFLFRNPHGLIRMTVSQADGTRSEWKAETNSPSILERRGWKRDSLKAGDRIKVEGWPARDGSHYLRMRLAVRSDGTPVGVPFETTEQK